MPRQSVEANGSKTTMPYHQLRSSVRRSTSRITGQTRLRGGLSRIWPHSLWNRCTSFTFTRQPLRRSSTNSAVSITHAGLGGLGGSTRDLLLSKLRLLHPRASFPYGAHCGTAVDYAPYLGSVAIIKPRIAMYYL